MFGHNIQKPVSWEVSKDWARKNEKGKLDMKRMDEWNYSRMKGSGRRDI